MQSLFLFLLVICGCHSHKIRTVATGFAWAENLVFDNRGNLFVSDVTRGEIHKIVLNAKNEYEQVLHIASFDAIRGLASEEDGSKLYGVGTLNEKHVVFSFS
jgi:sugar lactone lactonase YvrE